MISQKARYALRALVALARADDSMMIAEIAEQQQIPRKFLEQILLDLKHQGIVASRRGRLGGYDCKSETACEIRRVFARVAESARDVLDRVTIAQAIDDKWDEGALDQLAPSAAGRHA
jgi:DNA-binding IscR family transcriptional regulator